MDFFGMNADDKFVDWKYTHKINGGHETFKCRQLEFPKEKS